MLIQSGFVCEKFKKKLSGLSAGPCDSMFDVIEKWHKMYLPLMVYAELDKFFILLRIWVCHLSSNSVEKKQKI